MKRVNGISLVPTGCCGGESVCAGVGINLGLLYVKEPSVPKETVTFGVCIFVFGVGLEIRKDQKNLNKIFI